jgi:hypothetical protein
VALQGCAAQNAALRSQLELSLQPADQLDVFRRSPAPPRDASPTPPPLTGSRSPEAIMMPPLANNIVSQSPGMPPLTAACIPLKVPRPFCAPFPRRGSRQFQMM